MKIAVARPAAPAPTIAISDERKRSRLREKFYAAASFTGTVAIVPHALQRRVIFVGSSVFPITSVR